MSKSSAEFWDEKVFSKKEKEEEEEEECDHDHGCDRESAKALKRIVSLLDDLNNSDLRLLDEIIHRLLCEHKH